MKIIGTLLATFLIAANVCWGSSLLKDELKNCKSLGGEVITDSVGFIFSSALCADHGTILLSKGVDSNAAVVVDKRRLRRLAKNEKFGNLFYCYYKGNRNARLVYYGIFDLSKSGTMLKGKGKLIEGYIPDIKKQILVALDTQFLNRVVCESESDE